MGSIPHRSGPYDGNLLLSCSQTNGVKDPEPDLVDIESNLSGSNGLSWMGWTIGTVLRIRRLGLRIAPARRCAVDPQAGPRGLEP